MQVKTAILLICLIILTISCSTIKVEVEPILIPVPTSPEKPDLNTTDTGEGVLFSYEDAKKLLLYLNDVDFYMEELELILGYYNGDGGN